MADIRAMTVTGLKDLWASLQGALHVKSAPGGYRYAGQQQVTSAAATAYGLTVPPQAAHAEIHVTGADIYYDLDQSATPSSSHGDTASVGDQITLHGRNQLAGFRAVRQGSVNFTLKALYFSDQRDE